MYERISTQKFICSIKLHFDGRFDLLKLTGDLPRKDRRFFETIHSGKLDESKTYFSVGSFAFSENLRTSQMGNEFYVQEAKFRFPSNDLRRAERISSFKKVKFLEMFLNDGSSFVMGRNDIDQNTRPTITTSSNFHSTEVVVRSESIQPVIKLSEGDVPPMVGYDYTYNFPLS